MKPRSITMMVLLFIMIFLLTGLQPGKCGENENAYMTFDFYRDFPQTPGDSGNSILEDVPSGATIYMKIYAHNVKNIRTWEFRYRFDAALVELVDVRPDSEFVYETPVEKHILNKNHDFNFTVIEGTGGESNQVIYGAGYTTSTDTATAADGSGLIGVMAFRTTANFTNLSEAKFELFRQLFQSINDPEEGGDVKTTDLGTGALRGGAYTDIADNNLQQPELFNLFQNYPNPFNPSTNIRFSISRSEHVILTVYNSLGQEVATLLNKPLPQGEFVIPFHPENLPSGIYFYRLKATKNMQTKKMLYIK